MSRGQNKNAGGNQTIKSFFISYPAIVIIVGLLILFSVASPTFFRVATFRNAMKGNAYILLIAIAETLVILTGGIDLSVSTVMAISGVVSCLCMKNMTDGPACILVGILAAVAVGLLFGIMNGVMIGIFGMQSFVVTMGTRLIAEGIAIALTNSVAVKGPESMVLFGFENLFGIPKVFLISLLLLIVMSVFVKQSRWGRELILFGNNKESARHCGMNVKKIETVAYILSGALSGLAGFFTVIVLGNALPTIGATNLLITIGAVVLGGTSMDGGEGSVLRTLIGVSLLAILSSGLNAVAVPYTMQMIIQGLIIFIGYSLSVNVTAKSSLATK